MDYLELITVLFSATGFWKLVEFLFGLWTNRKKHHAEIRSLDAQTEKHIVDNWMQWSQTLEKRVKELEIVAIENKELKKQIESQRERIVELEAKVERVELENIDLHERLKELSKSQDNA